MKTHQHTVRSSPQPIKMVPRKNPKPHQLDTPGYYFFRPLGQPYFHRGPAPATAGIWPWFPMLAATALFLLGSNSALFAQNIVTDPDFELGSADWVSSDDFGRDNIDPAHTGAWEVFTNVDNIDLVNVTASDASTAFVFSEDPAATPIQAPKSSTAALLLAGLAFVIVRARWQRLRFLLRMGA